MRDGCQLLHCSLFENKYFRLREKTMRENNSFDFGLILELPFVWSISVLGIIVLRLILL